ncbi:MAG: carbohydrate ABC transporter permease [Armatimonadetes bacterium]|nr:carbohydrate ABC transporter permease [Armatimonadota bacterium]MDW8122447.1 carbohydrate ABC transporter permease [Armatimonadota bacterium]
MLPMFSFREKLLHRLSILVIVVVLAIYLIPLYWLIATSLKTWQDIDSVPPKWVFRPVADNYQRLFFTVVTDQRGTRVVGTSEYPWRFLNSIIIGLVSTVLAVGLGTLCAYATSRFRVAAKDDLLFFILSTRMLPPMVVVIPIFLMYRALGLRDTHLGLIILYTTFNVSFAVWLMKGYLDEIPKDYEEAAMLDRLSRFRAFVKVVLPQALPAIATTAVFCLISAWNEFAFSLILTESQAATAPRTITSKLGSAGIDWGQIAAGAVLFLLPVALFTFIVRHHLLRGVTFGTIKR